MKFAVFLVLVLVSFLRVIAPNTVGAATVQDNKSQRAYVANYLWLGDEIPVCWVGIDPQTEPRTAIVRNAISDTWEAASALTFTGWNQCSVAEGGIRIEISNNVWPQSVVGNRRSFSERKTRVTLIDGTEELRHTSTTMWLNLNFTGCGATTNQNCIAMVAAHEFGHAIGFYHEQSSPNTPEWCRERHSDGAHNKGTQYGPWDTSSIMNYCNPDYANNGRLSEGDIAAVQHFYGRPSVPNQWLVHYGGRDPFQSINTTNSKVSDLLIGDFNGDGVSDVLTTGDGAWWISYSGSGQWQLLNRSESSINSMGVGDFNGDGKTDILTTGGGTWNVSYGGTGQWTKINESGSTVHDMQLGDFNGDGKTDILTTGGGAWNVSYGGTGQWIKILESSSTVHDMQLGDFNGDGKTDILTTGEGTWNVSYGGTGQWTKINESGSTVHDMQLGDFNGDGKTDILTTGGLEWNVSYGGIGHWVTLKESRHTIGEMIIGDFNGDGVSDILISETPIQQ